MEAQVHELRPHPAPSPESTLLIVDDDEHVRRAIKRVLRRSRWNLIDVADAAQGLEVLEKELVHVVISDYRMPGMSGVEFLRIVKERWPRVQRVLLTGQADTTAIEEAVNQSEIYRFIWKPWDDSYLLLIIQSALDQNRMLEENDRLTNLLALRNAELERANRDLDEKLEARSPVVRFSAQTPHLHTVPRSRSITCRAFAVKITRSALFLARLPFSPEAPPPPNARSPGRIASTGSSPFPSERGLRSWSTRT